MRQSRTKKQIKKLVDGRCYFCPESSYELLDVHRIVEGKDGGKYHEMNTVTVCCKCHRKIHAGRIKIHRKYTTSLGRVVLHYVDEDGVERFD